VYKVSLNGDMVFSLAFKRIEWSLVGNLGILNGDFTSPNAVSSSFRHCLEEVDILKFPVSSRYNDNLVIEWWVHT